MAQKTKPRNPRIWKSKPNMTDAWDLASWLRNDNASVRSWAALTQCGMNVDFTQPVPSIEDPYGQIVSWQSPRPSDDDKRLYYNSDFTSPLTLSDGVRLPIVQASVQAFWDRIVEYQDTLGDWAYDEERILLFGDPDLYIAAWQCTTTDVLITYDLTFLLRFRNQLWNLNMDLVPYASIQALVDYATNRREEWERWRWQNSW